MKEDPNSRSIRYRLQFADGETVEHTIALDGYPPPARSADWMRLDFHQCPHCPLNSEALDICPFAAALAAPIEFLCNRPSFTEVEVQVSFRGRLIQQRTTLQRAAGSMLGATGASSGCPHTEFLRPMAWFHQPFSDDEETLFRTMSSYLLGQHLRACRQLSADWSLAGLQEAYRSLRLVNKGIADRLRAAVQDDSSLNGLILLDVLASSAISSLDYYEGELDEYFSSYLRGP
ncbi:hypothetical protein NG726_15070 [Pseudomonas sp. MOB-449]|nr:hypothetical protein [Pseudomonas sp. MOB-449]